MPGVRSARDDDPVRSGAPKTIEAHFGPPLPTVLRELADKLIADGWVRHATADDSSVYYIIGVKAHAADQEGQLEHLSLSVPLGGRVTVVGERQVHAQVASRKSGDYYRRSSRRFMGSASGVRHNQQMEPTRL